MFEFYCMNVISVLSPYLNADLVPHVTLMYHNMIEQNFVNY